MVAYEVRCHRCDVSFPAGTKVCLHCGGKTGEAAASLFASEPPALGWTDDERITLSDSGFGEAPAGDEAESVRRSRFGTAMSLFWVMLLIAGYLVRSCSS